jgi:hypothetical protein
VSTALAEHLKGLEIDRSGKAAVGLVEEENRVEAIRSLFERIESAEDAADPDRWAAAEMVAAEVEAGKSCRALGEELDRSAMYVSRYNRAWKRYLEDPAVKDGPFKHAYAPPRNPVTAKPKQPSVQKLLDILSKWDAEGIKADALGLLLDEIEAFAARLREELDQEAEAA